MKVKFLELAKSNRSKNIINDFRSFINKGQLMFGKKTTEFEKKVSSKLKTNYCLAVSSGTSALYLSMISAGIGKNDEVIVPALSWYSTFSAVAKTGAKMVVADINEDLLIDYYQLEKKISKKTKAVILVHFTGLVNDSLRIKNFCKKNKLLLIEDAAQAFGAIENNKKKVGSIGDLASFSANPMKLFGSIGEYGFITTSTKKYYKKLLKLRYSGIDLKNFECENPETNHKPDELHSIILLRKLKYLKQKIDIRIKNANLYEAYLTNKIKKPKFYNNYQSIYYTYSILVKQKDRPRLIRYLKENNIETKIQHHKTVLDIKGLSKFIKNKKDQFKVSDNLKNQILCLPVNENLKKNQIMYVIKKVNNFYEKK